jgi:putative spermidine/putrescine transport system permease protein
MADGRLLSFREGLANAWLFAFGGAVLLFLMAPIVIVIPMSFSHTSLLEFPPSQLSLRWYRQFFSSEPWLRAAGVSTLVAVMTTAVAVPAGLLAAYSVRCVADPHYRTIVGALVLLPIVVPGILIGVSIYFLFSPLGLANTISGLVLAHAMHALPITYLTLQAALAPFELSQERVARSLGASRPRAFLTVTLPQLKPSLLIASFLAFMSSFDEVVIALFIGGGEAGTLPRRMFNELRNSIDPTIAAISTLLILLSVVAYAVIQLVQPRARPG